MAAPQPNPIPAPATPIPALPSLKPNPNPPKPNPPKPNPPPNPSNLPQPPVRPPSSTTTIVTRPTSIIPPPPPPPPPFKPPIITATTKAPANVKTHIYATPTTLTTGNNARDVEDIGGNGMSGGAIAGMVAGAVAILIGSVLGGFMLLKKRKKRLMHVGKKGKRNNTGYPDPDLNRRELRGGAGRGGDADDGDRFRIRTAGYDADLPPLPPPSRGRRVDIESMGVYDEKSFHAARAGLGGARMIPGSGAGSAPRIVGDRYSQMNNNGSQFIVTGGRRGAREGGNYSHYPPFVDDEGGRDRVQSVVMTAQQLEREREYDLQQQARMLRMADAEEQGPYGQPSWNAAHGLHNSNSTSGHNLNRGPGSQYAQHYSYDDDFGGDDYGEYDHGYYDAQWGSAPPPDAYNMQPYLQQYPTQHPYASQDPYSKRSLQQQQQQAQQRTSLSKAVSPIDKVMTSMGHDFVPDNPIAQQQQHNQQPKQQHDQAHQLLLGIEADQAEGKEEYRRSVHGDGTRDVSGKEEYQQSVPGEASPDDFDGKEEYRKSVHDDASQMPGTPIPEPAVVTPGGPGLQSAPPPLPMLTKPKESHQSLKGQKS
ncbi:hypothetical protein BGX28_007939 [Mortierella sp. GBA30]|nr:hypothetical protein BGX28_007939 [Mortierella sp. GBA30]